VLGSVVIAAIVYAIVRERSRRPHAE